MCVMDGCRPNDHDGREQLSGPGRSGIVRKAGLRLISRPGSRQPIPCFTTAGTPARGAAFGSSIAGELRFPIR